MISLGHLKAVAISALTAAGAAVAEAMLDAGASTKAIASRAGAAALMVLVAYLKQSPLPPRRGR